MALTACGRTAPTDLRALLTSTKSTLDHAGAVHFHLTSQNSPASGTLIVGGDGDAKRPASFSGRLDVLFNGLLLSLNVVSVDHDFFVKLPLSSAFERAEPTQYAFNDPGVLLDPDHGLSTALTQAKEPVLREPDRYNGEELEEVDAKLAGDLVASLLTSADTARPRRDVSVTLGIDADKQQLRRVVLTGLFFDPVRTSTYTLILDRYGESVSITRPG